MKEYTKDVMRHLQELMKRVEILEKENAELKSEITKLKEENTRLQNLLNKNSSNSSKPPSTDGFTKIFNSREKTGKKPGGQPGHGGFYRQLYTEPTGIIEHKQKFCDCGHEIQYKQKFSAKQYVDVELKVNIVEHRSYHGKCPHCQKKYENKLPSELVNPVTYGNNLKAMTILLSAEGCVAVDRINQFFREVSNSKLNISNGTIINWQKEIANKTDDEIAEYKKELLQSPVNHKDETSMDVVKELHWLHVLGNKKTTLYHVNAKRGHEADEAMGVLPLYENVLVHDHLASLVNLSLCEHQECNAHILRYLKAEIEKGRNWAEEMVKLLVAAHRETIADGVKKSLSKKRLIYYEQEYDRIIADGKAEHTRSDERCLNTDNIRLLCRMEKYKSEHLLFLSRAEVPFDNNLAERDLRMIKTKLKVSGCFRSSEGADNFAKIKSVLSTTRKNSENIFAKLLSLQSPQLLAGV